MISPERIHQSDFDECARLMSNCLIISFLHVGSHYVFSMGSQDKGRKARQVKSVMRRCSHFHPLCISFIGQVRFPYHKVAALLGNEISKHHKLKDFFAHFYLLTNWLAYLYGRIQSPRPDVMPDRREGITRAAGFGFACIDTQAS